jgi:ADP-heptose:LPS heptosyltransferase
MAPRPLVSPSPSAIPIERLQAVDKRLGPLACALAQPLELLRARRRAGAGAQRVLLIKFWGIGSLQLLTPAVAALRRRHPRASLTLLTLTENEAFARGLGAFDAVCTLDVRATSWARLAARLIGLLMRLRRGRFERVYDFEFFTRFSALVSVATGAPALHGFDEPHVWRGGFHDHTVTFNRYWHVARNFRALAQGEDGSEVAPEDVAAYRPTADERARVGALLAALPPGRPYAVLNPNAGRLSLERRWPAASFAELAGRLVEEDGLPVVLVGTASERRYTEGVLRAVAPAARGCVTNLAGRLSIGELAALLAGAGVVVSNDSGPMHLAAATGAATIGLFGPETPVMYAPLGRRARALYDPPVCSPCINVHDNKVANCIHGRPECLVNLTVENVVAAARDALWEDLLRPAAGRAAWRVLRGGADERPAGRGHDLGDLPRREPAGEPAR